MAAPKGNKNALGCKTSGRPRIFDTPEAMWNGFLEYREHCKLHVKPLNKTGFCSFHDTYKDLFNEYKDKVEFTGVIKKIENQCENSLIESAQLNLANSAMNIFVLKNHHKYTDRQELLGDKESPLHIVFDKKAEKL